MGTWVPILFYIHHMINNQKNLIYYLGGCYGTFIEWMCHYLENTADFLPFESTGSSHQYQGNFCLTFNHVEEIIKDKNKKYFRCHPAVSFKDDGNLGCHSSLSFFDIIQTDLNSLLKLDTNGTQLNILILYSDSNTNIWKENNELEKIFSTWDMYDTYLEPWGVLPNSVLVRSLLSNNSFEKLKIILSYEIDNENLLQWGKSDINEFDIWEIRELMSLYWFNRYKDYYSCFDQLKKEFPTIKFVSIDQFKYNFLESITNIINYFGAPVDQSKFNNLTDIESTWRSLQFYIDRDDLCNQIISSLLSNDQTFSWENQNLTLLDEAYIQKSLRENNIEIKCYGINVFPKNSKDFIKLLERV